MSPHTLLNAALAGGLAAAFAAAPAFAASTNGTATAEIVTPIALVKNVDLDFGQIGADADGGLVTVAPNGVASFNGVLDFGSTDEFAAQFTASGVSGRAYSITLPGDGVVFLGGPGANMPVNTFTSTPSGSGTLTGGSEIINVGATLGVNGNQLAGSYTGTFTVTVEYN